MSFLISHVHPLLHVLFVCLILEDLCCLLFVNLLIKLLFDISESLFGFHFLSLFIHSILLLLLDLILYDPPLKLLLSLVAPLNYRICHPVHECRNLLLSCLPLSLSLQLLLLYHLVVLFDSLVFLVSFPLPLLDHLGLLDFILMDDFEGDFSLVLFLSNLGILFIIDFSAQTIHQL